MNILEARRPIDHHYFFGEGQPGSLTEVRFLQCPELIEPVTADVERLVRIKIEAAETPDIATMVGCMNYMRHIPEDMQDRPFWRGFGLMQYFVYLGADQPKLEPYCAETRYNIARQIGFLSLQLPKKFVEKHL